MGFALVKRAKTRVVAVVAQKGGAGKSTLTIHLASAAQAAGKRVAVLDMDTDQQSVKGWADRRAKAGLEPFPVYCPAESELENAIEAAKNDGVELLFIDSPPHAAPLAARIARAADGCLVPVAPDLMNMQTVSRSMAIVGKSERESAFVMSRCPPRAPEIQDLHEFLRRKGWRVFGPIHDRRIVARSINAGATVHELEPNGQAAAEVDALLADLLEMLK